MRTAAPRWSDARAARASQASAPGSRPVLSTTLRWLSVACGLAVAAAAFVVVGWIAVLAGCAGSESRGLCATHPGLVPATEWAIFLTAVLAPLGGGIATFVAQRARWLGTGVAIAVLMFASEVAVTKGQTWVLS
jgi:hypothetical protein